MKRYLCVAVSLFVSLTVLNLPFACSIEKTVLNGSGILLAFDDWYPESWEEHFALFDRYNVKVTFFVNGDDVQEFMLRAQNRGHEIGYHARHHINMKTVSRESFFDETVSRTSVFREGGIELTTFAYPHGAYEGWMNTELLKYYKVLRGATSFTGETTGAGSLKIYHIENAARGFVDAKDIDNIIYPSDTQFYDAVTRMLELCSQSPNSVIALFSHKISSDRGDWEITTERLEWLLKKGTEMGLFFYTFRDLQQYAD